MRTSALGSGLRKGMSLDVGARREVLWVSDIMRMQVLMCEVCEALDRVSAMLGEGELVVPLDHLRAERVELRRRVKAVKDKRRQ